MRVHERRKIVAWWLVVLLLRVLAPGATMLRLHPHQHADEEQATSLAAKTGSKAVLSAKHQHCHVAELYNAPFQPAIPPELPDSEQLLSFAVYRPQAPVCWAAHLLDGASLRGPPASNA